MSSNGSTSKPPLPLPSSTLPNTSSPFSSSSSSSSLIHRPPNGGYVSLLRQAISTLNNPECDGSAVRFNSLQRPNRGPITTSQRRDHQFRSMRTVSSNNSIKRMVDRSRSVIADHDKNNNRGNMVRGRWSNGKAECGKDEDKQRDDDGDGKGRDAGGSLTSATATFPKPAPRTRVPSASAAPPSLAHHDTYENLQQLLSGDGDNKVCNDRLLYRRVYEPSLKACDTTP